MALGVPYNAFWHLNPTKLQAFTKAYQIKKRIRDEEAWLFCGNYVFSAFQTVMAQFSAGMAGKKSNAKYIEKPVLLDKLNEELLSQEELDRRELEKMLRYEEQWQRQYKKEGLEEVKIL